MFGASMSAYRAVRDTRLAYLATFTHRKVTLFHRIQHASRAVKDKSEYPDYYHDLVADVVAQSYLLACVTNFKKFASKWTNRINQQSNTNQGGETNEYRTTLQATI